MDENLSDTKYQKYVRKQMKINKLADLKRAIGDIIVNDSTKEFPLVINFSRGLQHAKYKITFEEIEEDFFVDSKGIKWMKIKDEKNKQENE